jgi:methyltransferase
LSPFSVFASLLLATGAMRLVELAVSRRRLRRGRIVARREPWLFPLMALLHAALVFAPLAEVLWLGRPFVPALAAGSGTVLALATALRIWTLGTIGRSWNVHVVRPEPEAVVTTGPYAWVRHPNYLAVTLEITTLPLLHTAWISSLALSLLNALVLWRRIHVEEAELLAVPRWREAMAGRPRLLPGVF